MQLSRYRQKANRINHIFISHLHGDHYLGLYGLLSSMHLFGRKSDLHLFGPKGLSEIITVQLKHSHTVFNYQLHFHELDTEIVAKIFENNTITVETIPLNHRIDCCGFLFREKPKSRRIIKEKLPEDLAKHHIRGLKKGKDAIDENGNVILTCEEATLPPKKSRSYAYCSDTAYYESIIEQIKGVDLLYHEATFLKELQDRATDTYHSTTEDAAKIAQQANVGELIIGHFSSRYKHIEPFLEEAKEVFPNSHLAIEGQDFNVDL